MKLVSWAINNSKIEMSFFLKNQWLESFEKLLLSFLFIWDLLSEVPV